MLLLSSMFPFSVLSSLDTPPIHHNRHHPSYRIFILIRLISQRPLHRPRPNVIRMYAHLRSPHRACPHCAAPRAAARDSLITRLEELHAGARSQRKRRCLTEGAPLALCDPWNTPQSLRSAVPDGQGGGGRRCRPGTSWVCQSIRARSASVEAYAGFSMPLRSETL